MIVLIMTVQSLTVTLLGSWFLFFGDLCFGLSDLGLSGLGLGLG